MTKSNPASLALFLVLIGAGVRLIESTHPAILPGCTPLVALSFIAAAYLPHRWSWLVGVITVLVSEAAFFHLNNQSDGHFLSASLIFFLGFYLIMGLLGLRLSDRPSLLALYGGPLAGSLAFYLIANTISWRSLGYPQTFGGWMQANTTGMPGFPPVWLFLRNGFIGDLVFTTLLIMLLDPAREVFAHRRKAAVQS